MASEEKVLQSVETSVASLGDDALSGRERPVRPSCGTVAHPCTSTIASPTTTDRLHPLCVIGPALCEVEAAPQGCQRHRYRPNSSTGGVSISTSPAHSTGSRESGRWRLQASRMETHSR